MRRGCLPLLGKKSICVMLNGKLITQIARCGRCVDDTCVMLELICPSETTGNRRSRQLFPAAAF